MNRSQVISNSPTFHEKVFSRWPWATPRFSRPFSLSQTLQHLHIHQVIQHFLLSILNSYIILWLFFHLFTHFISYNYIVLKPLFSLIWRHEVYDVFFFDNDEYLTGNERFTFSGDFNNRSSERQRHNNFRYQRRSSGHNKSAPSSSSSFQFRPIFGEFIHHTHSQ